MPELELVLGRRLLPLTVSVLLGILLSLRFVVLPSLQALPVDEGVVFIGKVMARLRKILLVIGAVCVVSAVSDAIGEHGSMARLVVIAVFLITIALLGMPPGWAWYPRLLPRRRLILDAGLILGIGIMISWVATNVPGRN